MMPPQEWGPGEAEADHARLQRMEERVTQLAETWTRDPWPASGYANLLRTAIEDD